MPIKRQGDIMRFIFIFIIGLSTLSLNAQTYLELKKVAIKAHHTNNNKKAYSLTKAFIKKHPKDMRAQNLLAVLYYWSKDYQKAKEQLEYILSIKDYDESKKLLKLVDKKLKHSKKATKIANSKKPQKEVSYLHIKQANKNEDIKEADRLSDIIESDPNDLKSRVVLSKYYLKIGKYQLSYDLAQDALDLDPKNEDMLKIVKYLSSRDDIKLKRSKKIQKDETYVVAKERLKRYFRAKKYNKYLNLYKALKDQGERLSANENANALYSAVMAGEYKSAKEIIATSPLPHSRYKHSLQSLLDKKLESR